MAQDGTCGLVLTPAIKTSKVCNKVPQPYVTSWESTEHNCFKYMYDNVQFWDGSTCNICSLFQLQAHVLEKGGHPIQIDLGKPFYFNLSFPKSLCLPSEATPSTQGKSSWPCMQWQELFQGTSCKMFRRRKTSWYWLSKDVAFNAWENSNVWMLSVHVREQCMLTTQVCWENTACISAVQ